MVVALLQRGRRPDGCLKAHLEQALTLVVLAAAQKPIALAELVALIVLAASAALWEPVAQEELVVLGISIPQRQPAAQGQPAVMQELFALGEAVAPLVTELAASRVLLGRQHQRCEDLGFGNPRRDEPVRRSVQQIRQHYPLRRGSRKPPSGDRNYITPMACYGSESSL